MKKNLLSALLAATVFGFATQAGAITITGWAGIGNFGTSGADGVVTLSPYGPSTQYGWVSTYDSVPLGEIVGFDGFKNGSVLSSPVFSANAGDGLKFYFNYVTSDGAGYSDLAWAGLLNEDRSLAALLFTARTTFQGNTAPGFGMPEPIATLSPVGAPIVSGPPTWTPLGESSGACYGLGCGYTGWVEALYDIPVSGNYLLQFGVANWDDDNYDSGLAFDGATIAGTPIGEAGNDVPEPGNEVPEPATAALLGLGLLGLAARRRRR